MSFAERVVVIVGLGLLAATLLGLVRRRLHAVSYVFAGYVATVLAAETLISTWPGRFFNWTFWQTKETVYGLLKLAIGIELATLIFQAFPGARRRARLVALFVLTGILIAIAMIPVPAVELRTLALQMQARLANGTSVLFTSLWLLVFWYHLPLHRLHRAILRGFASYLLVFTLCLRLITSLGWDLTQAASYLSSLAYLALLAYWTWEAWRPAPAWEAENPTLKQLQPWRDRL